MKAILRIKAVLAHPSLIAYFFKDKIYIPLLFLLTFVLITLGISANKVYTSEFITRNDSVEIVNKLALNSLPTSTIEYDNHKMSGTKSSINYDDDIKIFFNVAPSKENYSKTNYTLFFEEEYVTGYMGTSFLFKKEYKDFNLDLSFKLSDVVAGNMKSRISFVDFLDNYMQGFEMSYKNQSMLGSIMMLVEFYFVLLIMMFIFTYFLNPTIKFDVRIKLMIYDSIIFLFLFSFSILFNVEFLKYIAFAISIFYGNITFRHIIKKR